MNMKKQWSSVLLLVLILIVALFAVLNVDAVDINFGFRNVEIPLVIVIIGSLLIGMLIAAILSTSIILAERNEKKQLGQDYEQKIQKITTEKEQLNNQYQEELDNLQAKNEEKQAEIRDLKRRINNMGVGQNH